MSADCLLPPSPQCEGTSVVEGVTVADLKQSLETAVGAMAGAQIGLAQLNVRRIGKARLLATNCLTPFVITLQCVGAVCMTICWPLCYYVSVGSCRW
jgi:hypothetical protein